MRRTGLMLGFGLALSSCGMFSAGPSDYALPSGSGALPSVAKSGPAADYPLIVGEPYFVGAKEYAPSDSLNYDEVGFVDVDYSAGAGVSGMHHTLPLPSYGEVTSLETGRTILVRMERRGPMASSQLLALSQGALAQLGAKAGDPIRLRRVNPPENERALLRMGQTAPMRMETPLSLAKVLKRKLPEAGSAPLMARPSRTAVAQAPAVARAPVVAQATAKYRTPELPPVSAKVPPVKVARADTGGVTTAPRYRGPAPKRTLTLPPIGEKPVVRPVVAAKKPVVAVKRPVVAAKAPSRTSTQTVPKGGFVVQAIALSSSSKANAVARKISGQVTKAGKIYRVRTGPFASRAQAAASLAKVRSAGYREARIFTGG